jgi:hypothetical protein
MVVVAQRIVQELVIEGDHNWLLQLVDHGSLWLMVKLFMYRHAIDFKETFMTFCIFNLIN